MSVSHTGSVAAAAKALQLTASPVSRSLRELEHEVGGALFERRYHRMELTTLGEERLPHAVEMLAASSLIAPGEPEGGLSFRFASTPWVPTRFADRILTSLHETTRRPVETGEDVSAALIHALIHGKTDLALVHLPVERPGIKTAALARYSFHIVCPADSPLVSRKSLTLRDLRDQDFVTVPVEMQPAPMKILYALLQGIPVRSLSTVELQDVVGLRSRILRTGEITIGLHAPDAPFSRMVDLTGLAAIPLVAPELRVEVGLAWRSSDGRNAHIIHTLLAASGIGDSSALEDIT